MHHRPWCNNTENKSHTRTDIDTILYATWRATSFHKPKLIWLINCFLPDHNINQPSTARTPRKSFTIYTAYYLYTNIPRIQLLLWHIFHWAVPIYVTLPEHIDYARCSVLSLRPKGWLTHIRIYMREAVRLLREVSLSAVIYKWSQCRKKIHNKLFTTLRYSIYSALEPTT